ncbi:conserved hypothetical protein [Culex quinquefasciatus]|uniref:Uncharacterized protein n=1 Tax=Culex quinquefasciatus TaxID=7176 RepID=B0W4Q0_CULQU|nr:conserved hypothetical protein [Culex quinquefasciatus]|eukprot:XP_001843684.1 conserved hypothetical protein [Culex quinquefasciatus]
MNERTPPYDRLIEQQKSFAILMTLRRRVGLGKGGGVSTEEKCQWWWKRIECDQLREQQLLNVFEVVVSTLEGKLQRIDNLDKAVEHLMRRVESLDNKMADNIHKTDSVISKLRNLDSKLTSEDDRPNSVRTAKSTNSLDSRLVSLDQKVSDIDHKLNGLKNQIDSNFLPVDDINAEASERKTVSMNVAEITKAMHSEVMGHITKELGQLRSISEGIDKKLQFHINIVSENLGKTINLLNEVHDAVVDHNINFSYNSTSTLPPFVKASKIDILVKQIRPIMSVSEKMDEVWDVVVGTKSSVDDLVPKSDALLTQNQRQERAIGEIHHDLKTKTNLIINNLDMVEKRLKKQEDDVAVLAQRPVPAELLMDPTIDRLVEYDPNRYSIVEDFTEPLPTTTYPSLSSSSTASSSSSSSSTTTASNQIPASTSSNTISGNSSQTVQAGGKTVSRKGGIIFPSVKNKPSVLNNTFATDSLLFKDIKPRSSLIDLERGRPARANYTTADFDLRCDPSRFPKGTLPDYCNDRAMTIFQGGCVLSVSKRSIYASPAGLFFNVDCNRHQHPPPPQGYSSCNEPKYYTQTTD